MTEKKVLIIEDNLMNMELVADVLEGAGFVVIQANNAEDGIQLVVKERPDIILMDISLPKMDGLTATTILKQDPQTRHIPIVAMTAHAMKGDKDRIMAAGCQGYLTKPIDIRSFPKTVEQFITGEKREEL